MEITIPEKPEKGKDPKDSIKPKLFNVLFVTLLVVLVSIGAFGLGKLSKIKESRVPVQVRYENLATSTVSIEQKTENTVTSSSTIRRVYVAARGGTVYYLPTCSGAQRIAEKNQIWFATKEEAERFGYKPAQNCKGL